jgi:uncharacterized protein (TIGR00645 family)
LESDGYAKRGVWLSAVTRAEGVLEDGIFNSRWMMAPFYIGLTISLAVLVTKFIIILCEFTVQAWSATESELIVSVLSLIDLSLMGNLILIVVFSGYVNFVSRIDPAGHPDWREWMAKIGFGGLKQKLLASIVAISAIEVLKAFTNIEANLSNNKLMWLVAIHLTFVFTTLLLTWSDRMAPSASVRS